MVPQSQDADDMSILITGAAGCVGRHVAQEFSRRGFSVSGLGWGTFPEYADWGLDQWVEANVSMESLLEFFPRPQVIVHCAGGASVADSVQHPRKDFVASVDATSQVLEFIRLHSLQTALVYPSSAAVYGNVQQLPIDEDMPLSPISPYGVHKLMCEQMCRMYGRKYEVDVRMVRLFSVYGEGLRKQLLWDACNKLSRGETRFFGTGKELRDWLHVSDAARLLCLMAGDDVPALVNGGSGVGVSVRDVLNLIMKSMNKDAELEFSNAAREGDPVGLVADIQQLGRLDWHSDLNIAEGVQRYVAWFQSCHG